MIQRTGHLRRSILSALAASFGLACGTGGDTTETKWQTLFEGKFPGALLRVWGTSSTDVYAVGADADGNGSVALHYDGTKWKRLNTGTNGDLWWVVGVAPDDIRMVGDNGLILKYTPSTDSFERLESPRSDLTLFGAWGTSSDVWYVGGNVPAARGGVWRDQGTGAQDPMPALAAADSATIFKVYGFAENEVWMVGQAGAAARWNGSEFIELQTGLTVPLFTVHGTDANHVLAVGGVTQASILAWNGTSFTDESPAGASQLNGIWVVNEDLAYACGFNGHIYKREAGAWTELTTQNPRPSYQDLHAIWVDETGAIWSVGGRLAGDPPTEGTLIHYGAEIGTEIVN